MNSNKKILIISYSFPPNPGVGGIRIRNLAKYFSKNGFIVHVLTARLPVLDKQENYFVIQTEEGYSKPNISDSSKLKNILFDLLLKNKIVARMLGYFKYYLFWPDKYGWWYKYAYHKAEDLLAKENIDVVISSALPVVSHRIASNLKKKFNFIWIAEYRDLWTYNHYYPNDIFYTFITKKYEQKILKDVNNIVTISEPLAEKLRSIHQNKTVKVITNGFDPDEQIITELTDYFSITYTGILYEGKRDPKVLLEAINELLSEGAINKELIRIRFYGPYSPYLSELINQYNLNSIVLQLGEIKRQEILKIQSESQLLLLLMYDHPEEKGVYTAKVFEYLNARRPILVIGNTKSVVAELMYNTKAGFVIQNKFDLKLLLIKTYKSYLTSNRIKYNGLHEEIIKYSYTNIINNYIKIFSC